MTLQPLLSVIGDHVTLGQDVATGRWHAVPLRDLRQTSTHIIGASGFGKSYCLRNLIGQLVALRQPFGLIDPHRELAEYALWRLRRGGIAPERIVLIDPSDDRFAVGFNPLQCGISDAGEASGLVLESFLKAWGARSFDETPRLEGLLRGVFRLLIHSRLTLLEAYDVLNVDNVGLRRALRQRLDDRFVVQDWEEFEKLSRSEKLAVVESSRNRLRRVLQARPVRRMLAQNENPIDFRRVLDDGRYVIANLGTIAAPETQRLIGSLLVNAIFHAAKRRNSRRRLDWWLICDEFGEFATRDFANSADQLRKFGVPIVCAHQRLAQIEREDPDILSAIMTNTRIKIVFGGLERVEATRMAHELFTGEVRGNRIKHIARSTKFRPILDTFVVHTDSFAETETETNSWSEGETSGESHAESESESAWEYPGVIASEEPVLRNRTANDGRSISATEAMGASWGTSWTHGQSRSVVPITRHEAFEEESGRQYWSLEEEWEERIGRVHGLAKREALIRIYNGPVVRIRTPDIEPERADERSARYHGAIMRESSNAAPVEAVERQIESRRRELAALGESAESGGRPLDVKSFRE
jgi:hypothetical protein